MGAVATEGSAAPAAAQAPPAAEDEVAQRLRRFRAIRNPFLLLVVRHFWWLQVVLLAVDVVAYSLLDVPPLRLVLILTPHVFVAVASVLAYRLFERVPATLQRLWDLEVLAERAPDEGSNQGTPRQRAGITARTGSLQGQFLRYVDEFESLLNRNDTIARGWVHVVAFGALLYVFFPAIGFPWGFPFRLGPGADTLAAAILIPDVIAQIVLASLLGLVSWRLMVIAWEVWHLAGDFRLRLQVLHPDKSGGTRPLGELCFSIAAIWGVTAIYPTAWIVGLLLAPLSSLDDLFPAAQEAFEVAGGQLLLSPLKWLTLYLAGLLLLTFGLAMATFFIPLYFVHRAMVRERSSLVADQDALARQADEIGRALLEESRRLSGQDDQGERDRVARIQELNTRLGAVQQTQASRQLVPSWPFDVRVFAKFVGATIIPLTGVTAWLPAIFERFVLGS